MKDIVRKKPKLQQKWLAEFQNSQPNKFNEEIIYGLRERDNMLEYLEDTCRALETIPYITYNGYELITDENKFRKQETVSITDNRLNLVIFNFTINYNGNTSNVSMPLFIPKWINHYYFILNGNKYFPIYQHVEISTYNTKNSVILKSLLMSIILQMKSNVKVTDIDDNSYTGRVYMVNLFNHKNNFLYYYFANMGFEETIKFFGYEKNIRIVSEKNLDKVDTNKRILFSINKAYYVSVSRNKFNNDITFKNFVVCVLDMFNKKFTIDRINDKDFWVVKLGSIYTKNTNNQKTKAETVILSFKRILDERTKKNLLISEEDKQDIFHLLKWMMNNFDSLMRKDNLSLLNKRLRLCEYIIFPFVSKMSTSTYRILNSKTINMNKLKSILKPNPMVIITELQKSKLLRFNNATNDMDLFNCSLRFSNRGPQSLGEGSRKTVSIYYRGIHISHIGRLSLNSISNSDPGMTGCLSPFVKTNHFYYSDTGKIIEANNND